MTSELIPRTVKLTAEPTTKGNEMNVEPLAPPDVYSAYEIRHELWRLDATDSGTEMHSAYNLYGEYIGNPELAKFLTGNERFCTRRPIRWVPRFITERGEDSPTTGRNRFVTWLRWNAWFHIPWWTRQPGITLFHLRTPDSNVCSMGFSPRDQTWYGWSHRARAGFRVGDRVKKGSTCTMAMEGWALPVGFKARTLDDARRMAAAHAESVS